MHSSGLWRRALGVCGPQATDRDPGTDRSPPDSEAERYCQTATWASLPEQVRGGRGATDFTAPSLKSSGVSAGAVCNLLQSSGQWRRRRSLTNPLSQRVPLRKTPRLLWRQNSCRRNAPASPAGWPDSAWARPSPRCSGPPAHARRHRDHHCDRFDVITVTGWCMADYRDLTTT